jgi:hypothetical protein
VADRGGEHGLTAHDLEGAGELHIGFDRQRHRGHRQHATVSAQQAGHPVETGHMVAVDLPQRGDEQIAHRVAGQLTCRIRSGAG